MDRRAVKWKDIFIRQEEEKKRLENANDVCDENLTSMVIVEFNTSLSFLRFIFSAITFLMAQLVICQKSVFANQRYQHFNKTICVHIIVFFLLYRIY